MAPGQPLFTLQPDPRLDQDLLDRALSRDIDNVDNRFPQAEMRVFDLQELLAHSLLDHRPRAPARSALAAAVRATPRGPPPPRPRGHWTMRVSTACDYRCRSGAASGEAGLGVGSNGWCVGASLATRKRTRGSRCWSVSALWPSNCGGSST